jgi:ClpP class serine protease
MQKLGVERRLLTAGENKAIGDPFSPMTDKQRAYTQATLDQIHKQFIRIVRDGRGKRLKETPEMFSGLFWNGEEAVKLGLADKFGNLDYVAAKCQGRGGHRLHAQGERRRAARQALRRIDRRRRGAGAARRRRHSLNGDAASAALLMRSLCARC